MKKVNKVFMTALSCLLAATYVLPVSAQDEVEKKESVYTVLNADGSVKSITVSDTLHSDSGFNNYMDTSDLKDVENLKSDDAINSTSGGYIWNTSDKDIYYQGTSTKDLPLTVKITYTLDGKEISSDDLVGESGHLVINVRVTNSSKQTYTANNKTYNLVTPFVTGLVAMLDDDKFSNVSANSGTVTSDSSHSIIASVMVPGLKSGLKQVLDSDLMHKMEDYLIDEISIEADVTDYESPTLMMAAATSTDALKEEFNDIDEFSSIFDKLDDLKEATQELIDGTSSLYDGAVKLNDGVSTLKDGASSLASGATTLYEGADKVASGAIELKDGLNKISANSENLRNGMSKLANTVLDSANDTLEENGFAKLSWDDVTKCATTETCVLDSYGNIEVSEDQRKEAFATIKTQTNQTDDSIVNTLIYMAAKNPDTSKTFAEKIAIAGNELTAAKDLSNSDEYKNAASFVAQVAQGTYTFSEDNTDQFANVLKTIRALTAQYPSEDGLSETYTTVLGKIIAAVNTSANSDIDDATAAQILAYACNNSIDTNPLSDTNIGNAINEMLVKHNEYKCEEPKNDQKVSAVIKAAYQSTVSSKSLSEIYSSTVTKIYNTLVNDNSTEEEKAAAKQSANLVFAYAVTKHNGEYNGSATYFSDYSGDLTTMQTANKTMDTANNTDEGKGVIAAALNAVVQSTVNSEMKDAKESLVSLYTLVAGVNEYTTYVDKAASGSKTLADGASQLFAGTKTLREGIDTLNSGVATLKDGSNTLADGAKTLKEGMVKYNDEAISKLTESTRITSLQEASNLLTAMSESEDNYNNYSGISEGTDGSIKFVFKIEGSKATKKEDTTTETTTEKVSFWQRILNLFKH